MIIELLKYAKSAIRNFDQSEASIVVMWLPKKASEGRNFFIADLAYMSNSKTILPLVIFWFGHYFKKKFSENPLLGPVLQFFSRILNNSIKKWDFIKNMSMPKVENQKLREQKLFSKNGQ